MTRTTLHLRALFAGVAATLAAPVIAGLAVHPAPWGVALAAAFAVAFLMGKPWLLRGPVLPIFGLLVTQGVLVTVLYAVGFGLHTLTGLTPAIPLWLPVALVLAAAALTRALVKPTPPNPEMDAFLDDALRQLKGFSATLDTQAPEPPRVSAALLADFDDLLIAKLVAKEEIADLVTVLVRLDDEDAVLDTLLSYQGGHWRYGVVLMRYLGHPSTMSLTVSPADAAAWCATALADDATRADAARMAVGWVAKAAFTGGFDTHAMPLAALARDHLSRETDAWTADALRAMIAALGAGADTTGTA